MITARQVNEMRKLRQEGATLLQIAVQFDVSVSTVQRWTNEYHAKYQKEYQKKIYYETKADPVKYQKMLEKQRRSAARYRQRMRETIAAIETRREKKREHNAKYRARAREEKNSGQTNS